MKFYDIDALENKCGIGNKYKITALVAARARWLSEQRSQIDSETSINEKYLSSALLEIENEEIPCSWLEDLTSVTSVASVNSSSQPESKTTTITTTTAAAASNISASDSDLNSNLNSSQDSSLELNSSLDSKMLENA